MSHGRGVEQGIFIAYQDGPRGTLHIHTNRLEQLELLVRIFGQVRRGAIQSYDLVTIPDAANENIASLKLVMINGERSGVHVSPNDGQYYITWRCCEDELKLAIDLTVVLARRGGPAHQYLPPDQREDDAEIELDYKGRALPGAFPEWSIE